ncbi:MAG TPA: hypothetical protein DDZ34_00545 [Syntrophaceae bacterium]|nr:hypothetical protein [Syntrophaceae bacterium]
MDSIANIVELTTSLPRRPRGRACIVFTHDHIEQKAWAAELAQQADAAHIHLLDVFSHDKALADNIGTFSINDLFRFLSESAKSPIIVVSGLEFLMAIWAGQANIVEQFARQIEMRDKSPALLIVMQHHQPLAEWKFTRIKDQIFIVDQRDTLALT